MNGLKQPQRSLKHRHQRSQRQRVVAFFSAPSPNSSRSFTISRYQSQNSPQKNW